MRRGKGSSGPPSGPTMSGLFCGGAGSDVIWAFVLLAAGKLVRVLRRTASERQGAASVGGRELRMAGGWRGAKRRRRRDMSVGGIRRAAGGVQGGAGRGVSEDVIRHWTRFHWWGIGSGGFHGLARHTVQHRGGDRGSTRPKLPAPDGSLSPARSTVLDSCPCLVRLVCSVLGPSGSDYRVPRISSFKGRESAEINKPTAGPAHPRAAHLSIHRPSWCKITCCVHLACGVSPKVPRNSVLW